MTDPGCSAAWLARLLWEQEAAGSNPASPTNQIIVIEHEGRTPAPGAGACQPIRGSKASTTNTVGGILHSQRVRRLFDLVGEDPVDLRDDHPHAHLGPCGEHLLHAGL